jgi:2-polyprenyl-3-methyl-5-hydroxy-6-metoxy-1,4-benzoquinol methylase
MIADPGQHWDRVYETKPPTEVSWFRPHLEVSLRLIEEAVGARDAHIIDVGAGASTLLEDLQARGYRTLHALDLSSVALNAARARLGAGGAQIEWICGDVRNHPFTRHRYDLWHDRAVFHFLTVKDDRVSYVRQVARAVKPGGHVIVATFGPGGPARCSGLDVVHYDPDALRAEFGPGFRLLKHCSEAHRTPAGATQPFTYCDFEVSAER